MSSRIVRAAASAAILLLLLATTALGHSQLTTATPGPDEEVSTVPDELVANFTQNLDAGRSSMELRDASGQRLATGAKDPAEPRVMRMALPELEPGEYEVRWTTFSTEDGELARGTYTFVVVAGPSPSPSASATPSSEPTPSKVAPPSVAPTITPAPSSEPGNGTEASGDQVIWPLLVLALVVASVGVWIYRRP